MKDRTSQKFHRKCSKCGTSEKFHTQENIDQRPNLSGVSFKNELSVDLKKIPQLREYRWKIKHLKSLAMSLSMDFWKNPHLENLDESIELFKSFIVNVLSVYLRKIPHF